MTEYENADMSERRVLGKSGVSFNPRINDDLPFNIQVL